MKTRKVTLKTGKTQKEYYVECTGCGIWRWTASTSLKTCMDCSRSSKLAKKQTDRRNNTEQEDGMIKQFLKHNKPSSVITEHKDNFQGMSGCYMNSLSNSSTKIAY